MVLKRAQELLRIANANEIKQILKAAKEERKRRYPREHTVKYGNIPRAVSEAQLERFLSCVDNEKANLAFTLMAELGLRVGEVVLMRKEHIDFTNGLYFVNTEKAGTLDCIPIHRELLLRLRAWCQLPGVVEKGWVLWSDNPTVHREHVSPHWLRKEFRNAAKLAEINASYGESTERYQEHRRRHLYQFTCHSLRHRFGRLIRQRTHDLEVTRALMRHRSIKSTQIYVRASSEELREAIETVFVT